VETASVIRSSLPKPDKVQEMRDLMFGEFAKYQVLPLDASAALRRLMSFAQIVEDP
jgi:hypothetical protein